MKKAIGIISMTLFMVAREEQTGADQELSVTLEEGTTVAVEEFGEVSLEAAEEEVTLTEGDTFTVIFENNTSEEIEMGQEYAIEEQMDEDHWESIELPLSFTLELLQIEPGEQHEIEVTLLPEVEEEQEDELPNYESGTYRVNKYFSIEVDGAPAVFDVPLEFEIE